MKKLLLVALVLLSAVTLTACGDAYMVPTEQFYVPDEIISITVNMWTGTASNLFEYADPEHIEELIPILETGFPPKRGKSITRDELPGISGGGLSAVRMHTADGGYITYYYGGGGCISADRSTWYRCDYKNFERDVRAFIDKYRDIVPGVRGNLE